MGKRSKNIMENDFSLAREYIGWLHDHFLCHSCYNFSVVQKKKNPWRKYWWNQECILDCVLAWMCKTCICHVYIWHTIQICKYVCIYILSFLIHFIIWKLIAQGRNIFLETNVSRATLHEYKVGFFFLLNLKGNYSFPCLFFCTSVMSI